MGLNKESVQAMGGVLCGYVQYDFEREEAGQYWNRKFKYPAIMEAEYVGYYLGSSMLTKGTTGLGVIQKPLREKYFNFRKSPDNRLGPEIAIRINPSGICLLFPGSEEFYEMSSVHFIETVRFQIVKQKDKKYHCAFVPMDDNGSNGNQDKLFTQLEKKFHHLTKITHPPMVACVMRRSTGVKAVDCHMFVIPVEEDALRMSDMVHRFQDRPVHSDYYDQRPPQGRPDMYPNPDVIPRDGGSRDQGRRNSGEDYALYRGRGVELRQDHFRKGDDYEDRWSNGNNPEMNRSLERPRRDFDRPEGRPRSDYDDRGKPRSDYDDRGNYDQDQLRSQEYRTGNMYVERDSMGREYPFDNVGGHQRQRSGASDGGRPLSDRAPVSPREEYGGRPYSGPGRDFPFVVHERQRSGASDGGRPLSDRGGVSPRDEYAGRAFNDRGGLSPRDEYGGGLNRSSDNFPRNSYGDRSPDVSRGPSQKSRGGSYHDDGRKQYNDPAYMKSRQLPPTPVSPRGRSPPRASSPPRGRTPPRANSPPPVDEVYSASNLESRLESNAEGKPIAKVPPHRHAGIRVLPSLPIPGVKNQLKPVSPRPADSDKSPRDEKGPNYNFDSQDYSDDDNPYDNAPQKIVPNEFRKNRAASDRSPAVERRMTGPHGDANRVKSDGYQYKNEGYNPNEQRSRQSQPQIAKTQPWSFDEEKDKFMKKDRDGWSGGYKSKSAQDFSEPDYGADYTGRNHGMKDAEIADMFSNLRAGHPPRHEVDFERSLGYLP